LEFYFLTLKNVPEIYKFAKKLYHQFKQGQVHQESSLALATTVQTFWIKIPRLRMDFTGLQLDERFREKYVAATAWSMIHLHVNVYIL
jgi:hypothetical protein